MRFLTPSRVIAAASLAVAALSFGVAYASPGGSESATSGANKACVHGNKLERNKANVVAYYTRAFNDGEPEDAVDRYVGFDKPGQDLDGSGEPHLYIQHNPMAKSGAPAFIEFVNNFKGAFPELHIDIRRVIAECDMVVTHGVLSGAEAIWPIDAKVVDIFRMDEKGKVVEHWDVLSPLSPTSENGNPEV